MASQTQAGSVWECWCAVLDVLKKAGVAGAWEAERLLEEAGGACESRAELNAPVQSSKPLAMYRCVIGIVCCGSGVHHSISLHHHVLRD